MKKINTLIAILFFSFAMSNIFSQSASVTWPLTSNQNPNTPFGNIQASPQVIGTPLSPYKLEMWPQQPYAANGQQLWTGNQGTGWIAGLPDYTRFIQFDANPIAGNDFTVQYISFQYSDYANPGNTNFHILKSEVWYAIDNNWNNAVKLNSNPLDYLSTTVQTFSANINVLIQNGHTFSLRIYPYAPNGAIAMTPSFAVHRKVTFEGRTSPVVINGSICGIKFNDLNGNGKKDNNETGLSGVKINLSMGAVNMTATTGADGSYCFNNLPAGTYTISGTPQNGWRQTYPSNPSSYTIVLASGQNVINIDFGNNKTFGSISGIKFNDLNGTGDQQIPTEPGLPNWIINLTGPVSLSDTTDANGNYQFNNLPSGIYTVTETNQNGWQQIYPNSPASYTIILAEGETIVGKNFANRQILSSICGMKFNDLNGNGLNDNEPGLSGWIIELKYKGPNGVVTLKDTTDSKGNYCFNNLPFGNYTITEVNKSGWTQTAPASPGSYTITINQEVNLIGKDFGNKEILNPDCTDFENNSMNGWQANNLSTSFQQNGNNNYIQLTDQAGTSTFYTTSKPYIGNWTSLFSNGCGSLCFDINFIYGGDVYNGITPPQTLIPYIAIEGAGFKAGFIVNQSISVGSGWHTFCAPLNFLNSDGTLPSNADGYWVMSVGTASDWNTLLTNVTQVRLLADPSSYQHEKIGYDNICLKNTGDCNPPQRLGSICGFKIHDKNGDGRKDPSEPGIEGWQINISGPVDLTIKTDKDGNYCFDNLPPGTYIIKEEQKTDWVQTVPYSPNYYKIELTSGQNLSGYVFGNKYEPKPGCVPPPYGMVAWWSFDFSARDARQDLAGYNNFGNMLNGPLQVAGKVLGALQFDGVDDYVEVADHSELNFGTGDFSFDAWIKTSNNSGISPLVDKRDSLSGIGYLFFLYKGNLSVQLADASMETNYISSLFVADGNWHHIAITVERKNKNGIVFYLDGVATTLGDPTQHTGSLNNNRKLRIGREFGIFASIFKGILDEIELFKRVLTPQEVKVIYNAGSAGKCKLNSQGGSVSGGVWYDLNHNGVKDPGKIGLAHWSVYLNGASIFQTETDDNGNFVFTDLKPGDYTLSVASHNNWSNTFPHSNIYSIMLESGQSLDAFNFGYGNNPCSSGIKSWSSLSTGTTGTPYYDYVNALP